MGSGGWLYLDLREADEDSPFDLNNIEVSGNRATQGSDVFIVFTEGHTDEQLPAESAETILSYGQSALVDKDTSLWHSNRTAGMPITLFSEIVTAHEKVTVCDSEAGECPTAECLCRTVNEGVLRLNERGIKPTITVIRQVKVIGSTPLTHTTVTASKGTEANPSVVYEENQRSESVESVDPVIKTLNDVSITNVDLDFSALPVEKATRAVVEATSGSAFVSSSTLTLQAEESRPLQVPAIKAGVCVSLTLDRVTLVNEENSPIPTLQPLVVVGEKTNSNTLSLSLFSLCPVLGWCSSLHLDCLHIPQGTVQSHRWILCVRAQHPHCLHWSHHFCCCCTRDTDRGRGRREREDVWMPEVACAVGRERRDTGAADV